MRFLGSSHEQVMSFLFRKLEISITFFTIVIAPKKQEIPLTVKLDR